LAGSIGTDRHRWGCILGADTSFGLGSGEVVINNPTEEVQSARLTSVGARGTFSIVSSDLEIPTGSTREGTGSNSVHSIPLLLQPGETTLRVTRGSNVVFNTDEAPLQVVVNPLTADETRNTVIVGIVVVLAALFYISSATNHGWIRRGRVSRSDQTTDTQPA
jgi:hypothetical protein